MKLKLFSIYDVAVKAFRQVLVYSTVDEAIRSFRVAANSPDTEFNNHPRDFVLHQVGEIDTASGKVVQCYETTEEGKIVWLDPVRVCSAFECLDDMERRTKILNKEVDDKKFARQTKVKAVK